MVVHKVEAHMAATHHTQASKVIHRVKHKQHIKYKHTQKETNIIEVVDESIPRINVSDRFLRYGFFLFFYCLVLELTI